MYSIFCERQHLNCNERHINKTASDQTIHTQIWSYGMYWFVSKSTLPFEWLWQTWKYARFCLLLRPDLNEMFSKSSNQFNFWLIILYLLNWHSNEALNILPTDNEIMFLCTRCTIRRVFPTGSEYFINIFKKNTHCR